jgi:hypothetical protein
MVIEIILSFCEITSSIDFQSFAVLNLSQMSFLAYSPSYFVSSDVGVQ